MRIPSPAPGRRRPADRRVIPLVAAVVLALTAVLLGITRGGGDEDGGGRGEDAAQPTARPTAHSTAAPRQTRPLPDPRDVTVPAVRSYAPASGGSGAPASGEGWRPADGTRVVAGGPEVLGEAMDLAGDLGVPYEDEEGDGAVGDVVLRLDDDVPGGREAYRIDVRDGRAFVTGPADAGVFYGTRTVLQAVRAGGGLPAGRIEDRPDRPQRGLMVDIARKHFSAEWLEARLEEMADLKYNQLGLHFSDDQAFRVQSEKHPEIVSEPHLTKGEVRRIVERARDLHITVVPEIDSPGHLGAVLDAHPGLQLRTPGGDPVEGAIDISKPAAGRLVDELLDEFAPLFPGPYWHLGGDEYAALMAADPDAAHPDLAAAARQRYGPRAGVADLAAGWLNDREKTVRSHGKRTKAWNDGFIPGAVVRPDADREVEYWTGKEIGAREPEPYLEEGRKVVNLNDEYLYYVLGEPNDFTYPTGERIYEEWTPAVLRGTDPVPAKLAGPDRVLGARLAVWCDLAGAQTPGQVAEGIRLPLAALAQKVWDPRPPKRTWGEFKKLAARVDGR